MTLLSVLAMHSTSLATQRPTDVQDHDQSLAPDQQEGSPSISIRMHHAVDRTHLQDLHVAVEDLLTTSIARSQSQLAHQPHLPSIEVMPSGALAASDREPGEPYNQEERGNEEQKVHGESKPEQAQNDQQRQQDDHDHASLPASTHIETSQELVNSLGANTRRGKSPRRNG
jgi:hypothetical protein